MTACGKRLVYAGKPRACSLPADHTGPCRTWVEQADEEQDRPWRDLTAYDPAGDERVGLTR